MSGISLTVGSTTLVLDPQLEWTDEHSWSPVAQAVDYSLTGALIVQTSVRQAGRPITLVGDEQRAWVKGADLSQLKAWRQQPGLQMALSLRGESYSVIFRHDDDPALDAKPVFGESDQSDTTDYTLTLKLMVI